MFAFHHLWSTSGLRLAELKLHVRPAFQGLSAPRGDSTETEHVGTPSWRDDLPLEGAVRPPQVQWVRDLLLCAPVDKAAAPVPTSHVTWGGAAQIRGD